MDDTLSTSPQAREDAFNASVEAGLVPRVVAQLLTSMVDVDAMYAECQKLSDRDIFVCRVPRDAAERGIVAGAVYGLLIANMPENVQGRVMLSFDGWADDPRPLSRNPAVVDFCNGLIYGANPWNNADPARPDMARAVLPFLIDEVSYVGSLDTKAWDITGRNWVVSIAHAAVIYKNNLRDVGLAMSLCDIFLEEGE